MDRKLKTRQQRQQRRARKTRRFEFVLSADSDRDQAINEYLETLPTGQGGEFVRQAIMEKIARTESLTDTPAEQPMRQMESEPRQEPPRDRVASAEFEAIMGEIAALKESISKQQRQGNITPQTPDPISVEATPHINSGGSIDMSGPRRKLSKIPTTSAPISAPTPTQADLDAATIAMLKSIRAFKRE